MRTQWHIFTAAPHRMLFFGGMLQLMLTVIWWSIELIGRYTDMWTPLQSTVPSTWGHAFLMLHTLFTFFIFGFLMTTYPRWTNSTVIPKNKYITTFLLLFISSFLVYMGLIFSQTILLIGIAGVFAAWATGFHSLLWVYFRAYPEKRTRHERTINTAMSAGGISIICFFIGLLLSQPSWVNAGIQIGLWLYLLPTMFAVAHRMIPFFSSCVLENYMPVKPQWTLPVVLVLTALHTLFMLMDWRQLVFLADIPLLAVALYHTVKWQFFRSFSVRLLTVLHIAFLWLSIALFLYSTQSLYYFITDTWILANAPLHAMSIGFFVSLLVGMTSRVMRGHSGRPLIADQLTWISFLVISVIALIRIGADIPAIATVFGFHLNLVTLVIWCIGLLPWIIYYLPMVARPRIDGKEG